MGQGKKFKPTATIQSDKDGMTVYIKRKTDDNWNWELKEYHSGDTEIMNHHGEKVDGFKAASIFMFRITEQGCQVQIKQNKGGNWTWNWKMKPNDANDTSVVVNTVEEHINC